jgi:hypothetical protein
MRDIETIDSELRLLLDSPDSPRWWSCSLELFVTADRNFAHAWAVCVPDAEKLEPLKRLYGIRGRAYYEVELLDASGDLLRTPPEPDPDCAVGSFQVDMARVIAVHRPQMSPSAAQVHMLRMATTPRNI